MSSEEEKQRDQDQRDAMLWRKHKSLFPLALAILEAASPLVLAKLKFQDAANAARDVL